MESARNAGRTIAIALLIQVAIAPFVHLPVDAAGYGHRFPRQRRKTNA